MRERIFIGCIIVLLLLPSLSFSKDFTVTLDDVSYPALARIVYGDILKKSFILDKEATDSPDNVSVNWVKLSAAQIESLMTVLTNARGFDISNKFGSMFIEKRKDSRLYEVIIYRPQFRSARYLSDIVSGLTTAKTSIQRAVKNPLAQTDMSNPSQDKSSPTSANALLDRPDADTIVFNVPVTDVDKVKKLLADLDVPTSEILLRAAVYEVGNTKGQGGAMQLVGALANGHFSVNAGGTVAGAATASIAGGGFSLLLSTLDADSHFKTISKPSVRVRSGSQAKFSVGQSVPVLGAASLDKNGNPVQSVQYMQSGDILTVTPDVHGEVIDLDVMQEVSSFVNTTTGVNSSPTLQNRTVTSSLSVKSGEFVLIAGLNQSQDTATHSRFFGFTIQHSDDLADTEIIVLIEAEKL
jgi:general secretion pathway protein D